MVNSEGLCPMRDKPCVKDKCMWYMHTDNIARCAIADISKGMQNINHHLSDIHMEGLDVSAFILNNKSAEPTINGPPVCCPDCKLTYDRTLPGWRCAGCGCSWRKEA